MNIFCFRPQLEDPLEWPKVKSESVGQSFLKLVYTNLTDDFNWDNHKLLSNKIETVLKSSIHSQQIKDEWSSAWLYASLFRRTINKVESISLFKNEVYKEYRPFIIKRSGDRKTFWLIQRRIKVVKEGKRKRVKEAFTLEISFPDKNRYDLITVRYINSVIQRSLPGLHQVDKQRIREGIWFETHMVPQIQKEFPRAKFVTSLHFHERKYSRKEHRLEIIRERYDIDLEDMIQRRFLFSLEKKLDVMIDVAYSLHALHSYGYVHRDLKPSNILCQSKGEGFLSDFDQVLKIGPIREENAFRYYDMCGRNGLVLPSNDTFGLMLIAAELIIPYFSEFTRATFKASDDSLIFQLISKKLSEPSLKKFQFENWDRSFIKDETRKLGENKELYLLHKEIEVIEEVFALLLSHLDACQALYEFFDASWFDDLEDNRQSRQQAITKVYADNPGLFSALEFAHALEKIKLLIS